MTTDDVARPTIETVSFTTTDGIELVGDLAVVSRPQAAAIVCHPHTQYGGNRFDNVVEALFTALPQAGIATLRFDFRAEFGGGIAERLDAVAAIDTVADVAPSPPLFLCGYSFGAMVALGVDDDRITGKALVAPPLGAMEADAGMSAPTMVLTPAHDQFAPPDVAEPIVSGWPNATFEVIDSVDHFIAGRTAHVADRIVTWIETRLP